MHPHIQTWGSMLRLYGSKMAESYLKVFCFNIFLIFKCLQTNSILRMNETKKVNHLNQVIKNQTLQQQLHHQQ